SAPTAPTSQSSSCDRECGYAPGMRKRPGSIWLTVVVAAFLVAPASSQATLAFTRNPFNPTVFAARDNGSGAHRIGPGSGPRVSPDGQTIVFFRFGQGKQPSGLMVVPATGGTPKLLAANWQ